MGAVIVELMGRGSEVLERHRFQSACITLGRAYDNDVIIADPFVAPHQAELQYDADQGWILADRDPVNPTRDHRERPLNGPTTVSSGMVVVVGATPMRLLFADHVVGPTQRIGRTHVVSDWIDRAAIAVPLVMLAWFGQSYLDYLGHVHSEARPARHGMAGLVVAFLTLAWSAHWALVARLSGRRRSRFWGQWVVACAGVIALSLTPPAAEYATFWLNSRWAGAIIRYGAMAIVAGAGVFMALVMATRIGVRTAGAWGHGVAVCVLGLAVLTKVASMPDFRVSPRYAGVLKPPLPWAPSGAPQRSFAETADAVFAALPDAPSGEDDAAGQPAPTVEAEEGQR